MITQDYARLGQQGFLNLVNALLLEAFGPTFRPFGAPGPDGGRDGTFRGTPNCYPDMPGYWVIQQKFHDVHSIGIETARQRFIGDVRKELAAWSKDGGREDIPDYLLFITNVLASGAPGSGTWDKFDQAVAAVPTDIKEVLLWDKHRLDLELFKRPTVSSQFFQPSPGAIQALLGSVLSSVPVEFLQALFPSPNTDAADPSVNMESSSLKQDLLIEVSVVYIQSYDCVIADVAIGNNSDKPTTLREIELILPSETILYPDEPYANIFVEGVEWLWPPQKTVQPGGFEQFAVHLPCRGQPVREQLATCELLPATVNMSFFPQHTFTLDLSLFSMATLKKRAEAESGE